MQVEDYKPNFMKVSIKTQKYSEGSKIYSWVLYRNFINIIHEMRKYY